MADSQQSREVRRAARNKRAVGPVSAITTSARDASDQSGDLKRAQKPGVEVPRKNPEVVDGSAESREPNCYDAGCTKDSLFGGGGTRPIPDRLRQLAASGDGGGDNDGDSGGAGGSSGNGGNGGDAGDGDDEDNPTQGRLLNPSADVPPLNVEPDLEQFAAAKLEEGDMEAASTFMRRILDTAGNNRVTNLENITKGFLRSGRLDSHKQATNFQKSYRQMLNTQSQLSCLQLMIQSWFSQGLYFEAFSLYAKVSHYNSTRHFWPWE